MEYFATRPSSRFKVRTGGSNTAVETFGNMYAYRHHIRGPDGPRGGIKSFCGRRISSTYSQRLLRGATAAHVLSTVQGVGTLWYTASLAPGQPDYYWYDGYTFRLCAPCCQRWVERELRNPN